ncbi:competence protein ComA [Volucribacter amazonae]|uniref:Competence protein A n=1 Tax=Volucribacter amazonae TaxID=256731 RepID=A0A9X4PD32_9PAST|nr:competence protein ComA [Volucribacter amazonae]MDG6896077.1 hypothetical protein [Volucribacter amazonae]
MIHQIKQKICQFQQARIPLNVGIWQDQSLELLWFDQQQTPHVEILPLTAIASVQQQVKQQSKSSRIQWVTAILPQHTWSKRLILPHLLSPQECEQQCHYTLQQELPLANEQIWFDYCYQTLPVEQNLHASQLDIVAINSLSAQQYIQQFLPIKINVLDHLSAVLLRAFYYLCPELQHNNEVLWLYQDQQMAIAIQDKPQQCQLLQKTSENLTALIQQYQQSYAANIKHYVLYRSANFSSHLAKQYDWHLVDNQLPLIPLGCALWGKANVINVPQGNSHYVN